jgi:arginine exporter protein ArgO
LTKLVNRYKIALELGSSIFLLNLHFKTTTLSTVEYMRKVVRYGNVCVLFLMCKINIKLNR